jgi:type VI secretion system protein ImpM
MGCGIFGKLPAKRDFIAYGVERPLLGLIEGWMQSSVAASRDVLGARWQELFLAAPIWRFWLGTGVAPFTTCGALMPSVDGVGRYFPLSILAAAPPGAEIPPPPDAGLEQWCTAAEALLLQCLEDDPGGEPAALAAALGDPPLRAASAPAERSDVPRVWVSEDGSLDGAFGALSGLDDAARHAARSYWWTLGGDNHPAQLWAVDGMPRPEVFAAFISGPAGNGARR